MNVISIFLCFVVLITQSTSETSEIMCSPNGLCFGCNITDRICECVENGCLCPSNSSIDCSFSCGGNSTTPCSGCDGIPWSGKKFDRCGVCDGNSSTCSSSQQETTTSSSSTAPSSSPSSTASSSSVSSSIYKAPHYSIYGLNAGLYAVIPLLILVGLVVSIYLKFKSMHEGGLPKWLAMIFCCCCSARPNTLINSISSSSRRRRYHQVSTTGEEAEDQRQVEFSIGDEENDDIESNSAADNHRPLAQQQQQKPPQKPTRPVLMAGGTTPIGAAVIASEANSTTNIPTTTTDSTPASPPALPKSNWDVQWDDEDGSSWGTFDNNAAKKPKSIGQQQQ